MATPTSLTTELGQLAPTALNTELDQLEEPALKKAASSLEERNFTLFLGGPKRQTAWPQGGVVRGSFSLPQLDLDKLELMQLAWLKPCLEASGQKELRSPAA